MIYLDYQATTPLAPEVLAAMRPWTEEKFANPHSPSLWGSEAAAAIAIAREQVEQPRGPALVVQAGQQAVAAVDEVLVEAGDRSGDGGRTAGHDRPYRTRAQTPAGTEAAAPSGESPRRSAPPVPTGRTHGIA